MRVIPTQVHAALDVVLGGALIVLPWAAGFSDDRRLTGISVGLGAGVLALGLLTDYEVAPVRVIPIAVHLLVDFLVSVFLIALAAGVAVGDGGGRTWAPLLGLGIGELLVVATTQRAPAPRERLVPAAAASGT